MQETQVWPLSWEDPLKEEIVTHPSILAWEIPWTEKPGGLQSIGSQRVGHDWMTEHIHTCTSTSAVVSFSVYILRFLALVWRNTPGMINPFHKQREINTSHKVNHEAYFPRKLHYFKSRFFVFCFFSFLFWGPGQPGSCCGSAMWRPSLPSLTSSGALTSGGRVSSPSSLVALMLCKGEMDGQLAPMEDILPASSLDTRLLLFTSFF